MTPTILMTQMTSLFLTVTSLGMMTCHGLGLSPHGVPATRRHPLRHIVGARPQLPQLVQRSSRHRREVGGGGGGGGGGSKKDHGGMLRYGVLLDAGSSSTKIKVYSYVPTASSLHVPHVRLEVSEKERPGLGSFVRSSPAELQSYLVKVVAHATARVPQDLHSSTPIFVMATAGMRVLPAEDAKNLLQGVREVLGNASLSPFLYRPHHVTILSGEEEAVYAWLAVNYLRGFFSSHRSSSSSSSSPPSAHAPVGVLEMGGGSMQVAFLPDTPLYQEEFQVYVGRRRFDLYAQTYLSYGSNYLTDQVRRRLVLMQRKGGGGGGVKRLDSPCMLSDDTASFELEGVTYEVGGTGDVSGCETVLSSILAPPSNATLCSPGPCAIGDTYQPKVGNHPFYAIGVFLYAPKNLDAVEAGDVLNITKLRDHARKYCHLTVSKAVSQTGGKRQFASNDCLMGLYIPLLLTTALGFDPHTTAITVANQINGTRIDWALGAMMQHLSMTFMQDLDCHANSYDQPDATVSVQKVMAPSLGSRLVVPTSPPHPGVSKPAPLKAEHYTESNLVGSFGLVTSE
ncbi:hypothetical protein ACOMHN_003917 [Nucella lapillus]